MEEDLMEDIKKEFKHYMTCEEAAELWDCTPRWVRHLCNQQKINCFKFSGVWFITKAQEKPISI
jgi:hypothetical protein